MSHSKRLASCFHIFHSTFCLVNRPRAEMQGASLHQTTLLSRDEARPSSSARLPVTQRLLRRLPPSSTTTLRQTPTPTGSCNIAKGCRASARLPWYPCQLPESKPITPPHSTATSSVCNELRRASVRETSGRAQLLLQAWHRRCRGALSDETVQNNKVLACESPHLLALRMMTTKPSSIKTLGQTQRFCC